MKGHERVPCSDPGRISTIKIQMGNTMIINAGNGPMEIASTEQMRQCLDRRDAQRLITAAIGKALIVIGENQPT